MRLAGFVAASTFFVLAGCGSKGGSAADAGGQGGVADAGGTAGIPDTAADSSLADSPSGLPKDVLEAPPPLQGPITCPDPALTGTVRYVCDCGPGHAGGCQPGSDAADGTSPQTAWQSWAKAQNAFASLPAGGIIAFCRGGSIPVGASDKRAWYNTQCRRDQRCVVRDYVPPGAAGELPRPLISVAADNLFNLEDSGDPDHDEGYIYLNLDLSGGGTAGEGFFVYNDSDDVLICNVRIDGFQIGVNIQGSNPQGSGNGDGKNERIVMRNSQVTNNSAQGWLGACDGCTVEYSVFDNNGFGQAVFNHNIYFGGEGSDERIVGNVLTRSAVVNGSCQGVSLVVHGQHAGMRIEGNTISEAPGSAGPGCWGIAVDTGYSDAEGFHDLTIAGNLVEDVGNISIGVAACDTCVIENNVIVQSQEGDAIAAPDRDRGTNDTPETAVTIRNNSILYTSGISGTAIVLGTEGTGNVVVSNAIKTGGGASGTCFQADLAATAYAAFDYNVCDPGTGAWAHGTGKLKDWQAKTGFDTHSLASDPGYLAVSPPYALSSGPSSPLIGAGDPARSSATSISGTPRGSPPDVGAYQR
jgi:hypothetical protein